MIAERSRDVNRFFCNDFSYLQHPLQLRADGLLVFIEGVCVDIQRGGGLAVAEDTRHRGHVRAARNHQAGVILHDADVAVESGICHAAPVRLYHTVTIGGVLSVGPLSTYPQTVRSSKALIVSNVIFFIGAFSFSFW